MTPQPGQQIITTPSGKWVPCMYLCLLSAYQYMWLFIDRETYRFSCIFTPHVIPFPMLYISGPLAAPLLLLLLVSWKETRWMTVEACFSRSFTEKMTDSVIPVPFSTTHCKFCWPTFPFLSPFYAFVMHCSFTPFQESIVTYITCMWKKFLLTIKRFFFFWIAISYNWADCFFLYFLLLCQKLLCDQQNL